MLQTNDDTENENNNATKTPLIRRTKKTEYVEDYMMKRLNIRDNMFRTGKYVYTYTYT